MGAALRTKNARTITRAEHRHLGRVRALPCSVCDEPGPSAAHHIVQGQHWTAVALCWSCHQGPHNGWHGNKHMWSTYKLTEIDALSITLQRMLA
jgi:hypothetical protein